MPGDQSLIDIRIGVLDVPGTRLPAAGDTRYVRARQRNRTLQMVNMFIYSRRATNIRRRPARALPTPHQTISLRLDISPEGGR